MPKTPTADAQSFRRGARERVFAKLVRVRLLLAPVLSSIALAFAFFEPTTWRRAVIVSVVLMLLGISVVEWARYRRHGLGAFMVPINMVLMAAGQAGFALATGGLFSPLIPALALMAVLAAAITERATLYAVVGGVQLPALWAMAFVHAYGAPVPTLVPALFGDAGALEHGVAPWIAVCAYTAMFLGAGRVGVELRAIFEVLHGEAMEERDRSLALHAEQSRALTTLSGEIAHELKNPLASVKGLSSLLSKDVSGKGEERLAVLRREVDRMQTILEEFLNFSRPLVPLALAEVELAQLARDVARLHEGTAIDLGVTIRVESQAPVWLACDPRKVRQVLINLVQNGLDVSPRASELRMVIERDGSGGKVRVIDRGPGIAPEVADRLFEAGVTSKEHGSGLGLAIARSLARQHGGTLALRNGEDGGCEGELRLPRRPESDEQEREK